MTELQGQPREQRVRVGTHAAHEAQRLGVSTDQDMLAVVEVDAVHRDAPRPAAEAPGGFEDGDRNAARGEDDRGGEAGPARADDRYAPTHVRQAIQSFRIGVRAMRCVSTREPSRRISSSSVR